MKQKKNVLYNILIIYLNNLLLNILLNNFYFYSTYHILIVLSSLAVAKCSLPKFKITLIKPL